MTRGRSLAQLAEGSGFGVADIAFLAGLEESTVGRLWDNPQWVDRVQGKSLQAIISVLPGVSEYVRGFALANRRHRLSQQLDAHSVAVNTPIFRKLVVEDHIPEQYVSNALEAAHFVLNGDVTNSAAYLARFWGKEQDFALGFLFNPSPESGLLANLTPLIEASAAMMEMLANRSNSFHAIVAQAVLSHHIVRATGQMVGDLVPKCLARQNALMFRSGTMGLLIQTNDREVAERYEISLGDSKLLDTVEHWSFPTYTHDARPTTDFTLPRSLLLKDTALELLREIETYNEAYFHYLITTCIPRILERDKTFGLRLDELRRQLERRLLICSDRATAKECEKLLKSLAQHASTSRERDNLEYIW